MATPRGYTDPDKVAAYLGLTLTAPQVAAADWLTPAVEATIDERCGRAWLLGVQTDEAHWAPFGRDLYLLHPPATAVAAVKGRAGLGAAEATLTAGTDYEVRDLAAGRIWLAWPGGYDRIRVTYTPAATLPADIELAATELLGRFLQEHLRPDSYGLESVQLPDLTLRFARWMTQQGLPPSVEERLEPHRFRAVA